MLALYCQIKSRERKDSNNKATEILKYYTQLDAFTEVNESDLPKCRVCLQSASVYIYKELNREDIVEALEIFGNINLNSEDQYPKHLCRICWRFVQEAILFRKIALKSNKILSKSEETDDRGSNNLKSDDIDPINPDIKQEDNNNTAEDIQNENPLSNNDVSDDFSQEDDDFKEDNDDTIAKNIQNWTKDELNTRNKPQKMIKCNICEKIMTNNYYYKKHVLLHDPYAAKNKYICEKCGKEFMHYQSIVDHQVVHMGTFPFKCDHCPYRGRTKDALTIHSRIHTGVKKFLCIHCPARFYSSSNLKTHMFKHQTPQFQCNECERAFHTEFLLKKHVDDVHLGIRPYACNVCGKAFGYRKKLMVHLKGVHKRPLLPKGRLAAYLVEQAKLNKQDE